MIKFAGNKWINFGFGGFENKISCLSVLVFVSKM